MLNCICNIFASSCTSFIYGLNWFFHLIRQNGAKDSANAPTYASLSVAKSTVWKIGRRNKERVAVKNTIIEIIIDSINRVTVIANLGGHISNSVGIVAIVVNCVGTIFKEDTLVRSKWSFKISRSAARVKNIEVKES